MDLFNLNKKKSIRATKFAKWKTGFMYTPGRNKLKTGYLFVPSKEPGIEKIFRN